MPDLSLGAVAQGSRELRGYLARPDGDGPWPGVVVIHELWGLEDTVRRQADRLAAAGYLALAPNLFSDGGPRRCLVTTFRALMSGQGRAYADIEASRQHLLADPACTGKVGIIGFCMGGGFALMTAGRGFDVASANYGAVPRQPDRAFADACPVVASYGGRDPLMMGQAKKLETALTRAGIEHDVKTYPRVGHSFLNDAATGPTLLRPFERVLNIGPNPEAAADAWTRIETFFRRHLT